MLGRALYYYYPPNKKKYFCGNKAQLKLFDFKFALSYYQEGVGVVSTLLYVYLSLCWNDQDKEPIHHCNDRSKDDLNGQLTRMEGGLKEQMDVLMFLILAGLHCSGKALSKS